MICAGRDRIFQLPSDALYARDCSSTSFCSDILGPWIPPALPLLHVRLPSLKPKVRRIPRHLERGSVSKPISANFKHRINEELSGPPARHSPHQLLPPSLQAELAATELQKDEMVHELHVYAPAEWSCWTMRSPAESQERFISYTGENEGI